ncbi:MAG: metallophosphoesterase [Minicystis sp.]
MLADRRRWAALGVLTVVVGVAGAHFVQGRPGVAAPGVASTLKGPYLQGLGATGVTVKVELSANAAARVEIRRAGESASIAPIASAASDGERTFHAIRVNGLQPATAYEYEVTAGPAVRERGRFTTAPADVRPFRFLVYGDNRSDDAAHAAVVRAMQAVPADFIVNTGDMVAKGTDPADWRTFFAVEGAMLRDRCLFAAVGNHELYRGDREGEVAFLRYFGGVEEGRPLDRLYGTFRWSNTRFFMLNAMDKWTGAERDWLRAELDKALREPGIVHRIAVMHWGPFSAGPHGNNPALASGDVITLMRDRKVDLVLAGHDHEYERGAGSGLKYIVSGGGGAPLYQKKADMRETATFEAAYHFVEVTVDGEQVRMVARRASGAVIEACGFIGMGPWDCGAR